MTLSPKQIIAEVAAEFGIDPSEFKIESRQQRLIDAKHEAMARIHETHRELSLRQIGRHFANPDHSSVINALKRLKAGRYANGRPRQRMPPKPVLTRETARRLYLDEGLTMERIAKDFGTTWDVVRKFIEKHELRSRFGAVQTPPPAPPPHVVASVHHQIDFKRAGLTAEWYRANCEISPLEDARERRELARHPRTVVLGHQHGSWMGSPAALCAV